jgi:hypothetical protein
VNKKKELCGEYFDPGDMLCGYGENCIIRSLYSPVLLYYCMKKIGWVCGTHENKYVQKFW